VAELLNELYAQQWSWFRNFFCPVMKHLRTEVVGSRKRRIYDQPATPFARLKASAQADPAQIARLEKLLAKLDPFELKETIEQKLRAILPYPNASAARPSRVRKRERAPEQTAAPPSSCGASSFRCVLRCLFSLTQHALFSLRAGGVTASERYKLACRSGSALRGGFRTAESG
jgi:hypothetical protein